MPQAAFSARFAASFATTFAGIVDLLCQAVAARGRRGGFAGPVIILVWSRLRRAARRIEFLIRALETGIPLPPPRPDPRRNRVRKPAGVAAPRHFAWLLQPIPEAATAAGRLRGLIADPEFAPLMASDARFGRILRPLCHALGVPTPQPLRPPPRPPKPAPPPETQAAPQAAPRQHNHAFAPPGTSPPAPTRWLPPRRAAACRIRPRAP